MPNHTGLPTDRSTVTRLAWIAADRETLLVLRKPMLLAAVERRHKVLALAPGLTPSDQLALLAEGIESGSLALPGASLNPFSAVAARRRLVTILADWRANTVVVEGETVIEFGVRAAAQSGHTAIYPVLPVSGDDVSAGSAGIVPVAQLQRILQMSAAAFVQTASDVRIKSPVPLHILPACTADTLTMTAAPLPPLGAGFVVLAFGQSAADAKGPPQFLQAVRTLQTRSIRAKFRYAAAADPSLGAVTADRVEPIGIDMDRRDSVASAIKSAHVVVIEGHGPSQSLALVTALALGRPVLATDTSLHREIVDAGVSGWLVPQGDTDVLSATLAAILKRPDLLPGMARAARLKAERRLSDHTVAAEMFAVMGLSDLRVRAA